MPDLLTHVLLAYVACTVAVRRGWLDSRHVPLGMIGTAIPDVTKLYLVVDLDPLSTVVGVDLLWSAFHTLGPSIVLAAIGALLFARGERRIAFGLFAGGAAIHLFLDTFVVRADGLTPPYLYPLTWWRPPSGDLYLSSDPWLSIVSTSLAVVVWASPRIRARRAGGRSSTPR